MLVRNITFGAVCLILSSCGHSTTDPNNVTAVGTERAIGTPAEIRVPLGLPPLAIPADNPITVETIALGRRLFHDPTLSMNDTISCASCHNPALSFTDARRFSKGAGGESGNRNAPTVINAAYARSQFWDGRASSLEEQAGGPIANPIEMNQSHEVCVSKLEADPSYRSAFEKAFGPGRITITKVQKAIASFERTIISGNSPFDRYRFGGDKTALSAAAISGLALFEDREKGNCATCHTIEAGYALFSDGKFHNLGVGLNADGEPADPGRHRLTGVESDKGAFKTPTLRNISRSAPYMHDGSLRTLRDVVDFYAGGGNSNPYLDKEIKPLNLTGLERADLTAFLESLTGETPPDAASASSK